MTRLVRGYKLPLLILIVAAGVYLHLYTQQLIADLRLEARSFVSLYANMISRVANTEDSEDLTFLFEEIIVATNFPLINTDAQKHPLWWKGIGVDPNDHSPEALAIVQKLVDRMEADPVPVRYDDTVLGYLIYGDSNLIHKLRWLPYVEVGVVGVFILIGFMGFAQMKHSEQRTIWVGMAKETAHQLGTPISSLMGWVEVLQTGTARADEIYREMDRDLQRLARVSQRFSQIGSKPDLRPGRLPDILQDVAAYIRRRTPTLKKTVEIEEAYERVPRMLINPDLFEWAIENLMKNSVDAMDKAEGAITLCCFLSSDGRKIHVEIADNGKGMDKRLRKRVFKPGFTTKRRGWGLGLSLAKRIVEEYHGGRLYVKESRPGLGTVMRIDLNVMR